MKKSFMSFLAAGIFVLLYSPFLAGQKDKPKAELSVRQRTEILFQNGMRNAQRQKDTNAQVQALRKALSKVNELRASQRERLSARDEKEVDRRIQQLKHMIAHPTPNESI